MNGYALTTCHDEILATVTMPTPSLFSPAICESYAFITDIESSLSILEA